jgi:hypothetical protein
MPELGSLPNCAASLIGHVVSFVWHRLLLIVQYFFDLNAGYTHQYYYYTTTTTTGTVVQYSLILLERTIVENFEFSSESRVD